METPLLLAHLLHAVCRGPGPLKLSRLLASARMERPDAAPEDLLAALVADGDADEGAALAADFQSRGIHMTCLLDDDYPLMLRQIPDPPLLLFYSGAIQSLHRPGICIVGAREAGDYGLQSARLLAGELARLGFTVVSGLARGVDGRVHQAALDVGGRTAAVLGTGVDRVYPAEHRDLARAMVRAEGCVISEFPPKTEPKPYHFPIRNRIISGLCHATIVIEAKLRSGSLSTARHALEQGREVFALPGPINSELSGGTNALIAKGEAQLLQSVPGVLEHLQPLLGMAAAHEAKIAVEIDDPIGRQIYETLDAFDAVPLDIVVARLGLEAGTVLASLTDLESRNLVESRPGQRWLRNPITS